jgi:saccharopine dehydrogenase (NAD+, L-lysine-forming)
MATIVVLGAGGGIGTVAARTVAAAEGFDRVVLADARTAGLDQTAGALGSSRTRVDVAAVDADDAESVRAVLRGATHVLNCIGPFYRYGPPLLRAAIDAGVHYVDVCDDLEPTLRMLDLDAAARDAGVCALIGMGNSPGLANVLTRYCADQLLDAVDTVDIAHIHGGEPAEGPAVLKHRIHAMTQDVPVFVDGALRTVRMLEDSGAEFVSDVDFREVGTYPAFPYPHPETVTLPRHLPGVRRVTNRGVVFPLTYFGMTQDLVRVGACGTQPVRVGGRDVIPLEFSVALLIAARPELLARAGVTGPAGCLRVDVTGTKDGESHGYVFSLSSRTAGAGEGTGIPAGLGALLMARGEIDRPGVHPPEAVVDPVRMLALAGELVDRLGVSTSGEGLPIHIAHRRPDGGVDEFTLSM